MSSLPTLSNEEFAAVAERATERNPEACSLLLELCRDFLMCLSRQRDRRREARGPRDSDVFQETYLRVMEEINSFKGCTKEQLIGWVRGIRDGVEVDLGRQLHAQKRDVRREISTDAADFEEPLRNAAPSAQEVAAEREQILLGRDILNGLRPDYVQVIRLREDAAKFEETARLMGRSIDAVRMLYQRALAEFAKQLKSSQ